MDRLDNASNSFSQENSYQVILQGSLKFQLLKFVTALKLLLNYFRQHVLMTFSSHKRWSWTSLLSGPF